MPRAPGSQVNNDEATVLMVHAPHPTPRTPHPSHQVNNDEATLLTVQLSTCLMMDGPPPQQSLLCDFVKQYVKVSRVLVST